MTIKELESILKYSEVDKDRAARVEIRFTGGTKELCHIDSFMTYTDGIVLNVNATGELLKG